MDRFTRSNDCVALRPPRLPQAGRALVADAGRAVAGRPGRAVATSRPSRSSSCGWAAGPSQLETFDPHPDTRIAAGTKAIATAVEGHPARRGVRATGRGQMGSVALDPVDGQQGGRPRARHVPDEDRLSARSDRRAPLDRRDLLPRAAGGPDRDSPAHLDPDRPVARSRRLPRRRVRRLPGGRPARALPDVAARRPGPRDAARVRDLDVVERAFARGRRGGSRRHCTARRWPAPA